MTSSANVQAFPRQSPEEGAEGPSGQSPDAAAEVAERGLDSVSHEEFRQVKEKVDEILKRLARNPSEETPEEDVPRDSSFETGGDKSKEKHATFRDDEGICHLESVRLVQPRGSDDSSKGTRGSDASSKGKLRFASYGTVGTRSEPTRGSMASDSRRCSTRSEYYDPNQSGSSDSEGSVEGPYRTKTRFTVFHQQEIYRELSPVMRALGVGLAFITVVFVWETVDLLAKLACPHKEQRLVCYLLLAVVAAVSLGLTFHCISNAVKNHEQTLTSSFAFALSTLFLAIGSWGAMYSSVEIAVPEKKQPFVWLVGGLFALVSSFFYSYQTRHNALLDIASCAIAVDFGQETYGLHSRAPSFISMP